LRSRRVLPSDPTTAATEQSSILALRVLNDEHPSETISSSNGARAASDFPGAFLLKRRGNSTRALHVLCLMTEHANLQRVWAIIERVCVCMLATQAPWGLRARPLQARPDRFSGLIWFVTDLRSSKEHEIQSDHEIGLVFIDSTENAYLSITGSANVLRDRAVAASNWRVADSMWWDGPDDPNVALLRVIPRSAELWDGPSSKAVTVFEFLKSPLTLISARTARRP
jgi:general stress protein 26